MRKLIKVVISAEFFFAMFLFVGYFKDAIGFKYDLAAVFLLLTIVALVKRLVVDPTIIKPYLKPLILLVVFFVYIIIGYVYSLSAVNAADKTLKLMALTIPSAVIPFFLFKTIYDVKRFTISIIIISSISALFVFPVALETITGFVGYGEHGNYQGLARLTGAGLILLMFYAFIATKSKLLKSIIVVLIVISTFVLLSSGSRMPLVAFAIILIYYLTTSIRVKNGGLMLRKELKYVLSLMLISIPVMVYLYSKGFFSTIFFRFNVLFTSSGGGVSAQGRTSRYITSIDIWGEKPIFGNGTGSYGRAFKGSDTNDYPHNLFLELLAENGIIGLLLLLLLIGFTVSLVIKSKKSTLLYSWVLFGIYFFFNAMVSGDINSNRMLFTALSTVVVLCLLNKSFVPNNKLGHTTT